LYFHIAIKPYPSATMTLDIQDCIHFANENKVCFLATAEEDQPHVRALGFWFADDTGFYFQTGDMKSLYHQLRANPKAEVCFYKHEGMIGTMLRVSGEVEFVEDIKLKERVLEERPFLKSYGLTINHPGLIIFRIPHGHAHFWTMENNLKPKRILCF
jgi:pyridoxamine 5'-phosphate oxidase